MRPQSADTPPEIEEILLEGYRRMHPVEKLRQVFDLNWAAQRMAAIRIEARYGPNLSERELRLRLAALWLDRETMIEAFGWEPDVEVTDIGQPGRRPSMSSRSARRSDYDPLAVEAAEGEEDVGLVVLHLVIA